MDLRGIYSDPQTQKNLKRLISLNYSGLGFYEHLLFLGSYEDVALNQSKGIRTR